MTETSSTSEKFRYFRWKLFRCRGIFFASAALNFFVLPVYSLCSMAYQAEYYKYSLNGENSVRFDYDILLSSADSAASLCFVAALILAAISGPLCFSFFTRKNRTDIFGSLPVSHKQRFWGDFFAGYISVAGVILPFGVFYVIMMNAAQEYINKLEGFDSVTVITEASVYFVISYFLAASFIYFLSVLAATVSGNVSGGIFTSIALTLAATFSPQSWFESFVFEIKGLSLPEASVRAQSVVPSPLLPINELNMLLNVDFATDSYKNALHGVTDIFCVISYILLFAAVITASFYLSKFRKAENTGGAFAFKHANTAVTAAVIFMLIGLCWQISAFASVFLFLIISAVICTLAFIAFEILMRRGKKALPKRLAAFGISFAAFAGALLITKTTSGLGLSYVLPESENIESVEYTCPHYNTNIHAETFYFSDEQDIKQFIENHHDLLKDNANNIVTGSDYSVKYKLKNGDSFERKYSISTLDWDIIVGEKYMSTRNALLSLPKNLTAYPEELSEHLRNYIGELKESERVSARLEGVFSDRIVKPEKTEEFREILCAETAEKFSPEKPVKGVVNISSNNYKSGDMAEILSDYDKTIAFLSDPKNLENPENEDDVDCFIIWSTFYDEKTPGLDHLEVIIKKKDLEDDDVKALRELMILLPADEYPDETNTLTVYSSDYGNYYILEENAQKAVSLLFKISKKHYFSR